jgi:hypothetical protein
LTYGQLVASSSANNDIKLLKEGFDKFYDASGFLITSLDTFQQQGQSAGQGDKSVSSEHKKGWIASHWYIFLSLIIIILAIVLVKYWGAIQKALSLKKKVKSQ